MKQRIKLVGKSWTLHSEFDSVRDQPIEVEIIDNSFIFAAKSWYCNSPSNPLNSFDLGYTIEILKDEEPQLRKESEFRAGDQVKVPWSDKVFTLINHDNKVYPLALMEAEGPSLTNIFTTIGKLFISHDKPVLTLVNRPKERVQKTFYYASYRADRANTFRHTTAMYEDMEELNKRIKEEYKREDTQLHETNIMVEE